MTPSKGASLALGGTFTAISYQCDEATPQINPTRNLRSFSPVASNPHCEAIRQRQESDWRYSLAIARHYSRFSNHGSTRAPIQTQFIYNHRRWFSTLRGTRIGYARPSALTSITWMTLSYHSSGLSQQLQASRNPTSLRLNLGNS